MPPDPTEIAIIIGWTLIMFFSAGAALSIIFPLVGEGPFTPVIDALAMVSGLLPYLFGGTSLVVAYIVYKLKQG